MSQASKRNSQGDQARAHSNNSRCPPRHASKIRTRTDTWNRGGSRIMVALRVSMRLRSCHSCASLAADPLLLQGLPVPCPPTPIALRGQKVEAASAAISTGRSLVHMHKQVAAWGSRPLAPRLDCMKALSSRRTRPTNQPASHGNADERGLWALDVDCNGRRSMACENSARDSTRRPTGSRSTQRLQ